MSAAPALEIVTRDPDAGVHDDTALLGTFTSNAGALLAHGRKPAGRARPRRGDARPTRDQGARAQAPAGGRGTRAAVHRVRTRPGRDDDIARASRARNQRPDRAPPLRGVRRRVPRPAAPGARARDHVPRHDQRHERAPEGSGQAGTRAQRRLRSVRAQPPKRGLGALARGQGRHEEAPRRRSRSSKSGSWTTSWWAMASTRHSQNGAGCRGARR